MRVCSRRLIDVLRFSRTIYRVNVTFVDSDGKETSVRAVCGDNLLIVAHKNDINLEGTF